MIRRSINFMSLLEAKLLGEKNKYLNTSGFTIWCRGKTRSINEVDITADKHWKK